MGGVGRERIHNMKHDFKFISKHSPQVKSAYSDLMEILSLVHDDLRKQYTFQHKPVGSYSRNMITYDAKSNIGFDFDINIYPNDEENRFTAKQIKLLFKQSLDKFAHRYGYDFAEDSTRVLTIKVKDRKNSRILHSVDFAFVNDYILDGDKIVHIRCPVNAVHIIVDGDKADVVVGKIVFGVIPYLQIFTPETGHILNDDRADISHFNIIEQLLKARSIEVCAGVAVIHIELGVAHMVFPGVCLEHFLLRWNLSRGFSAKHNVSENRFPLNLPVLPLMQKMSDNFFPSQLLLESLFHEWSSPTHSPSVVAIPLLLFPT